MTVVLPVPRTDSATDLWLRPWRLHDLPILLAAHSDPLLRHWLTTALADDVEARQWLAAQDVGWAAATRFSFAVVAADDEPLGHVVVKVGTDDTAEVGYWTAAAARGHGVAARALETVSRWALHGQEIVPLTRLELLHAAENHASCRVAVKCHYALLGHLPPAPPDFPAAGHRHLRLAVDESR